MSDLLSHRIQTLLLNTRRSFPSEAKDAKDMINEWRLSQRCKLVRPDCDHNASGAVDPDWDANAGPLVDEP